MKDLTTLSDEMLVSIYIKGNNTAFDVLLDRYEGKLFTYIYYAVKNKELAQDIFQETFMKAIATLHSGRYFENGRFFGWIMRIAHNLVIDHYRFSNNMPMTSADADDSALYNMPAFAERSNAEMDYLNEELLQQVRMLITRLPLSQREVVLMRFYQDLSFKEIAEITNVSINTALGRMRYALINLRRLAEKYNIDLAS